LKNKMPDELKKEITTYLTEVKADLENYLTWAMSEVSMGGDTAKAAEVVEDTIHRLMTIAYYHPRRPGIRGLRRTRGGNELPFRPVCHGGPAQPDQTLISFMSGV
jgi:hypothetical protein